MKIAAVYSTYNPDIDLLQASIKNLPNQINTVIIVDNSPIHYPENFKLLKSHKIIILATEGNTGIANALNLGCRQALEEGADWALTMDQDSLVPDNILEAYEKYILNVKGQKVGALVPAFRLCPNAKKISHQDKNTCDDYMTSGSLVNLDAYNKVKGFNEDLFIDLVDTDFGLKLLDYGYQIFNVGEVVLSHNIGNATELTFLGKHIAFITHHNYIRRYYITRNLLWLAKEHGRKYPKHNHPYWKILKSIIRIIVFEDNKLLKLQSVRKGIKDFKKGNYGRM